MSPNTHPHLNDEITQILQNTKDNEGNPQSSIWMVNSVLCSRQSCRQTKYEQEFLKRIHPESLDMFKLQVANHVIEANTVIFRRYYDRIWFTIELQTPFEIHRFDVKENSNLLDILHSDTLSYYHNLIIVPYLKKIISDFTVNADPPIPVPKHRLMYF